MDNVINMPNEKISLFQKLAQEKGGDITPDGYRVKFRNSHEKTTSLLFYLSTRAECIANGDVFLNFNFIDTSKSMLIYDDGKQRVRPYEAKYEPSQNDFPVAYKLTIQEYCRVKYGTKDLSVCFRNEQLPQAKFEAAVRYLVPPFEKYEDATDIISLFTTQKLNETKIDFLLETLIDHFTEFESYENPFDRQTALIKLINLFVKTVETISFSQWCRLVSLYKRYDAKYNLKLCQFHKNVDKVLPGADEQVQFYMDYYKENLENKKRIENLISGQSKHFVPYEIQSMHREKRRECYNKKRKYHEKDSKRLMSKEQDGFLSLKGDDKYK